MPDHKAPHIVVTGASGFVGTHVMKALAQAGLVPVGLCRKPTQGLVHGFDLNAVGDLSSVLEGAETIVHCAGRVHGKDDPQTALEAHRRANRDGTAELLRQAQDAGVKRFIFLSTVAVYGIENSDTALSLDHPTNPDSAYGISKLEAEVLLQEADIEVVILRVPLVYGPYGPGLWGKMLRLCDSPYPLPFDYVGNRRSMISVQNLADLVRHCVESNTPPNLCLALDGDDIGTTQIAQTLRNAFGRPRRLFTAPKPVFKYTAKLIRREYLYRQLFTSLRFERQDIGWRAPLSIEDGLRLAAKRPAKRKA